MAKYFKRTTKQVYDDYIKAGYSSKFTQAAEYNQILEQAVNVLETYEEVMNGDYAGSVSDEMLITAQDLEAFFTAGDLNALARGEVDKISGKTKHGRSVNLDTTKLSEAAIMAKDTVTVLTTLGTVLNSETAEPDRLLGDLAIPADVSEYGRNVFNFMQTISEEDSSDFVSECLKQLFPALGEKEAATFFQPTPLSLYTGASPASILLADFGLNLHFDVEIINTIVAIGATVIAEAMAAVVKAGLWLVNTAANIFDGAINTFSSKNLVGELGEDTPDIGGPFRYDWVDDLVNGDSILEIIQNEFRLEPGDSIWIPCLFATWVIFNQDGRIGIGNRTHPCSPLYARAIHFALSGQGDDWTDIEGGVTCNSLYDTWKPFYKLNSSSGQYGSSGSEGRVDNAYAVWTAQKSQLAGLLVALHAFDVPGYESIKNLYLQDPNGDWGDVLVTPAAEVEYPAPYDDYTNSRMLYANSGALLRIPDRSQHQSQIAGMVVELAIHSHYYTRLSNYLVPSASFRVPMDDEVAEDMRNLVRFTFWTAVTVSSVIVTAKALKAITTFKARMANRALIAYQVLSSSDDPDQITKAYKQFKMYSRFADVDMPLMIGGAGQNARNTLVDISELKTLIAG